MARDHESAQSRRKGGCAANALPAVDVGMGLQVTQLSIGRADVLTVLDDSSIKSFRANGDNPIAIIIPCHRVIRKVGEFGNYRYGTERKKALLARELLSVQE